jgi:hypothetical protein
VIGPGSARTGAVLVVIGVSLAGAACQLKRPDTMPIRMLEPQLLDPALPEPAEPDPTRAARAAPIRLLDTQSRGHIGRRLLHQQSTGELIEDAVWRWSSAPDRYLDTALRLELGSSASLRLVDAATAPALATNLLLWYLESASGSRLVGAVEFQFTAADRTVHTHIVRSSEPVSAELPGDLAVAAGRLLRRLAQDGLTRVSRER